MPRVGRLGEAVRVVCSLATQHELEYWTPTLFDYRDKRQLYTKMTVAWHSVNATVAKRLPTIILSISFFNDQLTEFVLKVEYEGNTYDLIATRVEPERRTFRPRGHERRPHVDPYA